MWPRSQRRLSQHVKHYRGLRLNRSSTTSKTQATNKQKKKKLVSLPAADAEAGASPLLLLFKPGNVSICKKPEELNPRVELLPAEMTGPTTRLSQGGATVHFKNVWFRELELLDCCDVSHAF